VAQLRTINRAASSAFRAGVSLLLASALLTGCASGSSRPADDARASTRPLYEYVSLDGRPISSEMNRGKVTVIAVIATYDLGSQVIVRQLAEIRARQRRALAIFALVLEPPKNAPLAEAFAATLELPFPIAMADQATLEARGPFGPLDTVPTLIVLSADGTETWRHQGAILAGEIEEQIARARRA
jgi:hypothetical protein